MVKQQRRRTTLYWKIKLWNGQFWPKCNREVKQNRETRRQVITAPSLNHQPSSCWKGNTNDSATHISWRRMKTTQLCGSFIRPANVILITSSISTHMSCTNAGSTKSTPPPHSNPPAIPLIFSHAHTVTAHCNLSLTYLSPRFTSHFCSNDSDRQAFKSIHQNQQTHTQYENWWWHVKLCVHAV